MLFYLGNAKIAFVIPMVNSLKSPVNQILTQQLQEPKTLFLPSYANSCRRTDDPDWKFKFYVESTGNGPVWPDWAKNYVTKIAHTFYECLGYCLTNIFLCTNFLLLLLGNLCKQFGYFSYQLLVTLMVGKQAMNKIEAFLSFGCLKKSSLQGIAF